MKRLVKTVFKILVIVVLVSGAVLFCIYVLPVITMFHGFRQQMFAGQKYMNSLTEKDFQVWSNRTQAYLVNYNSTNLTIGTIETKNIPKELAELKIVRIDVASNWINYVWMGGFDHTLLHIERLTSGQFEFTATYNDASNRVIWPKANPQN